MTTRENIVFLDRTFTRQEVLNTLSADSHSKLVICDNGLDKILGYCGIPYFVDALSSTRSSRFNR